MANNNNGTYVGPVPLEGTLSLMFVTPNGSDVPTTPDGTPTFDVYEPSGSTKRLSGQSCSTVGTVTGVYRVSKAIQASDGFAAGKVYSLLAVYQLSSAQRRQVFHFAVT